MAGNANAIKWSGIEGEITYEVFKDGKSLLQQKETTFIVKLHEYKMYWVRALNTKRAGSFLSELFGYFSND